MLMDTAARFSTQVILFLYFQVDYLSRQTVPADQQTSQRERTARLGRMQMKGKQRTMQNTSRDE